MEKDAIINILLNDIREMELLISTFRGKPSVPATYFKLAKSKLANIGEELSMVEELYATTATLNGNSTTSNTPIPATATNTSVATPPREEEPQPATATPTVVGKSQPATSATIQPAKDSAPIVAPDSEMLELIEETPAPEVKIVPPAIPQPIPEKKEAVKETVSVIEPKVTEPQSIISQTTTKTDKNTLGETLVQNQQSINETLGKGISHEDLTSFGTPVNDIKKAIGLNDRFYFQRELFGNNSNLFNSTLEQINTFANYNQAYMFLKSNFTWDETKPETEEFLRAVRRRFL